MSGKGYLKQWEELLGGQDKSTFEEFWKKYCDVEIKIYSSLLADKSLAMNGKFRELSESFGIDKVFFMGFLDGINTSLKNSIELSSVKDEDEISFEVDPELLYHNMLQAEADHLYTLPEWDNLLTDEIREDLYDAYRRSKTIIKEKLPGRNDLCPCGSGKKYKKCCGTASA